MQITRELVEHMAELARIQLSDVQTERLERELGEVLGYMELLNTAEPRLPEKSEILLRANVLREDEAAPSFSCEAILENAPCHTEQTFTVPKAVEG